MNTRHVTLPVDVPAAVYVMIGIAIVLMIWAMIRPRKPARPEPPELPQRRRPIDQATRKAREAHLDAVMAESFRSPTYLGVRLAEYEGEVSFLAEACLELDENYAAGGEEGDHAWR